MCGACMTNVLSCALGRTVFFRTLVGDRPTSKILLHLLLKIIPVAHSGSSRIYLRPRPDLLRLSPAKASQQKPLSLSTQTTTVHFRHQIPIPKYLANVGFVKTLIIENGYCKNWGFVKREMFYKTSGCCKS
jgi:hypothetical protein